MNFIPESNPQIRALAREAAEQIKTLSEAHDAELKAVYQDFRTQADAIKAETSTDELHTRSAGSSQPTEQTNR
jgi:hypothetical protein